MNAWKTLLFTDFQKVVWTQQKKGRWGEKNKRAPVYPKCRRHACNFFFHRQIRWEKNSALTNESHHGNMWGTEQSDVQPEKNSPLQNNIWKILTYHMTRLIKNEPWSKTKSKRPRKKQKNKKNWVYKIRGPYWNLREIRVRKPVEEDKEEEA